jgi:hypothetical protein
MEVVVKIIPNKTSTRKSLFSRLKFPPLLLSITTNMHTAIRYLKKRTENGSIPAPYRGRVNNGSIPYVADATIP